MSDRVIVTGAAGFIGRPSCAALVRRGFEVHSFVSPRSSIPTSETTHKIDLFDADTTSALVAKIRPTHLLHLAWITTPQYWTSLENLTWTAASLRIVDAFHRHGGRRLVCAGSCAEYDWTRAGTCQETGTPLVPATLYGTAKHALHELLEAYCAQAGLSLAWGRVFFVYGPEEREARLVPSVIRALLARQRVPCTDGEQQRDFMHVDDVGDAFAALLQSDVRGAVNLASGQPVALKQLVERIASKLDGRELVELGALPRREGDPTVLLADTTRLSSEVGWHPHLTLDEGLDMTIAWWRSKAQQ